MTRAERRARLERRKAQVRRDYWDWLREMPVDKQYYWVARRAQMRGGCSCIACRGHAVGAMRMRDARHMTDDLYLYRPGVYLYRQRVGAQ